MRIMDTFDQHNVKVTFFMTGGWVDDNPDGVKELVKRGHDLGNHSQHHYDMTTISKKEQEQELMDVHNKVKQLSGLLSFGTVIISSCSSSFLHFYTPSEFISVVSEYVSMP